jgi:hypothetical protein
MTESSKDDDPEAGVVSILRKFGSTLSCMKEDDSCLQQKVTNSRKTMTQNQLDVNEAVTFIESLQSREEEFNDAEARGPVRNIPITCVDSVRRPVLCNRAILVKGEFNWQGIFTSLNERVLENENALQILRRQSMRRLYNHHKR